MNCRLSTVVVAVSLLLSLPSAGHTQELETRYYINMPVGVNLFQVGYGRSEGNVLIDPSLPIEGLNADLNLVSLKYGRIFDFFGRSAKAEVLLPVATGHWEGVLVGEGFRERDVSGLADARFTLNVNFVGSPALEMREFRNYRQKTIVGAVFQVIAPTGLYDGTKLINIGANRWGFRPQIGISHAIGKWVIEAAGTLWLFTDNDDFFGGTTLKQDPLYAFQGHFVYSFKPGLWVGFDIGYADGGTTTIAGDIKNTLQKNTRAGVTFQYPFKRRHAIRIALSRGVRTRIGADFTSFITGYAIMWGRGL